MSRSGSKRPSWVIAEARNMDMLEWMNFAKEAKLTTREFSTGRIQKVFMDANIDRKEGVGGQAGDRSLVFHEYLEALVQMA